MERSLRELGYADLQLHPGDHVCAFHFGSRQRDELLIPYLQEGLRASERCVCILPPEQAPEVLRHLARGYLYKEIALRLGISVKTVEAHVSAVLRKLQLSNRHELSRWAVQRGWLE